MKKLTSITAAIGFVILMGCSPDGAGGGPSAGDEPAAVGPPNLNGVWQAMNTAHWDLEGHAARKTPVTDVIGALGAIPAGDSVLQGGGNIPYQAWALEQRDENRKNWNRRDRAVSCFIPGVPRMTYMPLPFHIVQSENKIFMAYEWGSNSRLIHLDKPGTEADLPSWVGYSLGRYEGDTLVVEVTDQMAETWFDATGNFHSANLKVTEYYTPMGPNHLMYKATIEDPEVFTEPWTIEMPLYRRMEENARILEYKCVEFGEDAMYGHLRRGVQKDPAVDY